MKISLDEQLAFVSVVDCGSITAAAGQLGQTVSGVSRALSRLEAKLDTTLLRRTTRRLELTGEGEAFLVHARAILAAVDAAEEQMAQRRLHPAGRLRVNASSPFMLHVIVPLIGDFRARYPQVMLELNSDELNIDLLEQRTDIAIRHGALRDSTLHARPLGSSPLRLLASPDYLQRRGAPSTVASLAGHALLGFTQPDSLNRWPLRDAHGNDVVIQPTLTASSGETLRRLALAGEGIACLSDFMTTHDRLRGDLVAVLPRKTLDQRQSINAVYYRNTQLAARITCFLDFVAERMAASASP